MSSGPSPSSTLVLGLVLAVAGCSAGCSSKTSPAVYRVAFENEK